MQQRMEIVQFSDKLPMRLYCYRLTELPSHWHSGIELILVLKGDCTVVTGDRVTSMHEDDILLVNDNTVHELRCEAPCTLISLLIDTSRVEGVEGPLFFDCDSSAERNKARFDSLKRIIAELAKANASALPENEYYNRSAIYSVLCELTKNFRADEKSTNTLRYTERLNRILQYIEEHYREGLTLNEVADRFHFSVPYLSSFFKRYVGQNFQTYYNGFRLERAVNDLLGTDLPIEQIAENNGFPNARAFVTSFKAKYGTLPSLYRRSVPQPDESDDAGPDVDLAVNSYMSLLTKYLPRPGEAEHAQKGNDGTGKLVYRDGISAESAGTPLKHTFRIFTSVSRAKELLFSDVQNMLRELQGEIGFEYIKFHGLLSDDMMVYTEDEHGTPHYSFVYIDKAFDFLLSIRLKPLVQFSYMPKALAKDPGHTVYFTPYVISMPKDMGKWVSLVSALTRHLIARYGPDTVRTWLFCCWNEPDTTTNLFGFERDEDFFALYRATYETVKGIDASLRFGSPSLLIAYDVNQQWCSRYIRWCQEHACVPDFMNIHYYDNDFSDGSFEGHRPAHPRHERLNRDEDSFSKCITKNKSLFTEWGIGDLPVYLTEWNLTVSHRNLLNDTCFKSCYLAKNLLENYDRLDSFGYWVLTDMIEETFPSREEFHGGLGLYTHDGIKKPHYFVFRFLNRLGDSLIAQGKGYFVTRSALGIQVIAYNYEHFSHLYAQGETFDMQFTERYTPFSRLAGMELSLEICDIRAERCTIREYAVNQSYGSAFDEWIRMGAQPLSPDDIAYLRSKSVPLVHVRREVPENGRIALHAALDPLEVRLIEITADI